MGDEVTAVPGGREVSGPGWRLRAERVEAVAGGGWRALVAVRRGVVLQVSGGGADELHVEAWAGEPDGSDGVAVIEDDDGGLRLARVPLCTCGDRGCGNAGVQFSTSVAGGRLPALAGLLRDLPWAGGAADRSSVLRGGGLAAVTGVGDGRAPSGSYSYAYSPLTGAFYFPER